MRFLYVFLFVFSFFSHAAKPPDEIIELDDSEYAGYVQLNEINISSGGGQYVELYVTQSVTITTDWHLKGIGRGNSEFFLACDSNWLVMESGSINGFACNGSVLAEGTYIYIVPGINLHNNFNEIILTDSSDLSDGSDTLVDYLLYSNNNNYTPIYEPSNPDSGSIIIEEGKLSNLCVQPDGSDNWVICEPTPGLPNDPSDEEEFHHFEISHDGLGSTCSSENVTIKACVNENCTDLYEEELSFEFKVNGQVKAFIETDEGEWQGQFSHGAVGSAQLSIGASSIEPGFSFECSSGTGSGCSLLFTDNECLSCSQGWETAVTAFDDKPDAIKFKNTAQVIGNPSNVLITKNIKDETGGSHQTCATLGDCVASGSAAFEPTLGEFLLPTGDIANKVTANAGNPIVIGEGDFNSVHNIRTLEINTNATAKFSENISEYRIGTLKLHKKFRVNSYKR